MARINHLQSFNNFFFFIIILFIPFEIIGKDFYEKKSFYNDTIEIDSMCFVYKMDIDLKKTKRNIQFVENIGEFIGIDASYINEKRDKVFIISHGYLEEKDFGKIILDTIIKDCITNIYASRTEFPCWVTKGNNLSNSYRIITVLYPHGLKKESYVLDSLRCSVTYYTLVGNSLIWFSYESLESIYSFSYEEVMEMMKSIRVYKKEDE